jgi:hypothetical protein
MTHDSFVGWCLYFGGTYYQNTMVTKITISELSLNTRLFFSKVSYAMYDVISEAL